MRFGPAGVPLCSKERSSIAGIGVTADLGLNAMELEFVHGCRMKDESARQIGDLAKKRDVSLSCHASYYLNLLSPEPAKREKTIAELKRTAHVLDQCGGKRLVFHSGFYLKMDHGKAYAAMKARYQSLSKYIADAGLGVVLAPEVTGKKSQFGSVQELYGLAEDIGYDKIQPAIDWGHVHARDNGALNTPEDFEKVLETVEKTVGKEGLKTLHCHVEGIHFTEKGERNHLRITEGPPDYRMLIKTLKKFKCDGTLISESPAMEEDALILQNEWQNA
ncbi:MAG: TIM barrel protein [Candidatus Micrarchaeota archaeon]|nr:TIM barrel protein [Candidatus Micrarchaeota archaeon]